MNGAETNVMLLDIEGGGERKEIVLVLLHISGKLWKLSVIFNPSHAEEDVSLSFWSN